MRLIRQSLRVSVPPDGGEHYWHGQGEQGYWSLSKPYSDVIVNAAVNPSVELNANRWAALTGATVFRSTDGAIHGNQGLQVITSAANHGVGYDMFPGFSFGTTYCVCISVDGPEGAVATLRFEYASPPGQAVVGVSQTLITLPGYPIRICTRLPANMTSPTTILYVAVRFSQAGEYKVDGLVITATEVPVTTYFDGDSPNAVWLGIPHSSTSSTTGFSRTFGEPVDFNEIGFNITGSTGFGLSPRQLITTPFARLNGAHLQRVKDLPRVITLTGLFEGTPEEMHEARRNLIDALTWRFKNQCTQEVLLTYMLRDECGCRISPALQIFAEYQAGLEGLWGALDRERATLTFVANSQQSFSDPFDSTADLFINGTTIITNEGNDDAWLEIYMWPGAGGMNVSEIHNDTTGHHVYFGTSASGGNPTALPLAFGEYAILRTDPTQRISLDIYAPGSSTRAMHYIRYAQSQVGLVRLVPGENQFRVVAPLLSTGSRVFFNWRNRYLSVDSLSPCGCVQQDIYVSPALWPF